MKRQWKWGLEDLFNLVAYYRNLRFASQHSAGYDGKFCAVCDDLGYIGCFCGGYVKSIPSNDR